MARKADTTRKEVNFIRWDVPARKQEDLPDALRFGEAARMDCYHVALTALNPTSGVLFDGLQIDLQVIGTSIEGKDIEMTTTKVPVNNGKETAYNREWMIRILQATTSDYVKIRIDPKSDIIALLGEVDDREGCAVMAPRVME